VEILSNVANVKFKHVPFKGSGEVGPAVMGSHVDFGTGAATTFLPLLKGGQVRALAITGKVRMKQLPDAKTFDEQGIKGDFVDNWTGFFVPVGTPQSVIDLLIQASQQVLKNKEFADRIEKAGGMVVPNTAAEFKAIIERDKKTAEEIAKKVGMTQPK
jgi:tripartite-type tricarboxylate transporter receptor subunit TctC